MVEQLFSKGMPRHLIGKYRISYIGIVLLFLILYFAALQGVDGITWNAPIENFKEEIFNYFLLVFVLVVSVPKIINLNIEIIIKDDEISIYEFRRTKTIKFSDIEYVSFDEGALYIRASHGVHVPSYTTLNTYDLFLAFKEMGIRTIGN
jgi:hypothetical protein